MISLPDFLRRIRRAWAPPGAPLVHVAPPTDVAARLEAEIQPLLSAISEIQGAAGLVRTEADRSSSELADEATREGEKRIREAERSAPAARAEAAKRRRESAGVEIARLLEESEKEAARIEAVSTERLPRLVAAVAACVLSEEQASP